MQSRTGRPPGALPVLTSLVLHVLALAFISAQTADGRRRSGLEGNGDQYVQNEMILLEIEPRLVRPGEDPASSAMRLTPATSQSNTTPPIKAPLPASDQDLEPRAAGLSEAAVGRVEAGRPAQGRRQIPRSPGERLARALRGGAVGCAHPGLLAPDEQRLCDVRFAERAALAAPISGSGDRRRDEALAAAGARSLARYEARRAPLSEADDPPCDKGRSPVADCEFEVRVDIFSSERGWFPNLKGGDE